MAENSKIEWTDHTFNPWIGCSKVSPGCDHCYAETRMDSRLHVVQWGAGKPRKRTSAANWREPIKWNARHDEFFAQHGRRQRVFCASLADVFDNEAPEEWRADLFELIRTTSNLDWLLLTKRPQNIVRMVRESGAVAGNGTRYLPNHVWMGATAEDQKRADQNIEALLKTRTELGAKVLFLSIEPLLGPVNILKWLDPFTCADCEFHGDENDGGPDGCDSCGEQFGAGHVCRHCGADDQSAKRSCPRCGSHRSFERDHGFKFDSEKRLIDWVIVGGESGSGARPMHPDWARSLRDQSQAAGVPFLFKQWGEWAPANDSMCLPAKKWLEFPSVDAPARSVRFFEEEALQRVQLVGRVGKKAAGRMLDGRTLDEYPKGGA
jgi:protein gp37